MVAVLAAALVLGAVGVVNAAAPAKSTTLWAQVSFDAVVQSGSSGISVVYAGSGTYYVDFGRNMNGCAIVATSGISNEVGVPPSGVTSQVAASSPTAPNLTPNKVIVHETIGTTTLQNSFSIIGICP